ncbi:MAG: hypothetical protein IK077_14020, partial [Thermoguttaceae bacterium]|nr:hypothetical protein [Thermoguttaceae bacterium]
MAKKHNPFSVFRRNQKAWMAGLTLFTMFSFIALGSMLQCVGSHNQGTGPRFVGDVAKTQKFGTLDYNEFLMARQDMLRFETFLNYLYSAAQEVQAIPSAQLTSLRMQISYAASDAEALVSRWLVLKFAESEKLVPNEEAVVEYLQQLTQIVRYDSSTGTATNDQFGSDVLAGASRSAGLNNSTLSELVKGQIAYEREIRKYDGGNRLASLYSQTGLAQMGYGHGPVQISPSEALKAYEALHRMAKAKVAVFKASDYVGEVADPSDVQARAFYEQYKDVVNRADSKEPGFTQPQLLALEIVRADVDDALLDSITDEEVKAFYEEHKEEFRRPKSAASAIEEEDEGPAQEAVSLEGSDASLITLPEDAIGSLDEEAPALELPAEEEAPVEEAPALELPAEEAPAEAPAEEGAAVYQKVDTLIAYQQEAEPAQEAPAEQAPAEQAPAAEAPAEQAPAEEAPAEQAPAEAPAEQAPVEEAPAEQAPAEEAPAEQAPAEEAPAEQAPAEEAPAEQAPAEEAPAEQATAEEAPAEQ